jgi:DNA primase
LEVKVLLLPDGHDPDSFARQNTPEQFREYVEKHETDIIRFKTKILINETKNDPGSRSQAIRSIVTTLANIPDRITRNVYIQECSRLLEIDESIISRETEESRIAIVQQWRKRKELERLNDEEHKDSNSANLATETQGQISIATTTNPIEHETDTASKSKLQPFEHEVIRYLVQYGMMRFSESVDHEGWAGDINVAMYVNKELEEDSVEFSTPIYKRIFTIIKEMQSDYDTDFKAFQAKVEIQRKEMLKNGYAKIAEQGLDTDSILKAEKKLEEDVEDKAQKDLIDFSRDYVSRKLASDEDNDVRLTVTRLISSPYVLSKYHKKTGNIENEADKLTELIPRAIMEWKDGILAEELIALKDKIRLSDNDENTIALMKQFNDYVELRRELAKMIGDRILTH